VLLGKYATGWIIVESIPTRISNGEKPGDRYMTMSEHSAQLAGVNLAGRNHVCAFFNTLEEEHRVLGSFYKDGLDRGEKGRAYCGSRKSGRTF